MKFSSLEVAMYLYKSTIGPHMEYYCHAWAGAPSCYLEMLDYKKEYVGLLVLHLLPLWNHWLIIQMEPELVFSIGITLVDVHLNWSNWLHFLILKRGLLVILKDCMNFLPPFLDVIRMSISTVSFLAQLDSLSLPIECFPLNYDLNGFKSRINWHLLSVGSS